MRSVARGLVAVTWLATVMATSLGCSVVTGFGKYFPADGADGGGIDAATRDSGAPDSGFLCEPACAAGETCTEGGVCRCGAGGACATGLACCDGECANLDTLSNCGACGDECGPFSSGVATCAGSVCGLSCVAGFGDCDERQDNGCEASLSSAAACGDCDTVCDEGELCAEVAGVLQCLADCPTGETECVGGCVLVGGPCGCSAGAAQGQRTCGAAGPICDYPDEVCNAADDDCDGVVDESFECLAGTTEVCTEMVGGCMATGTRTCNAACGLDACVIAERCDRVDNDCDGDVDEDLLIVGTSAAWGDVGSEIRGAWNATRSLAAVAYGTPAFEAAYMFLGTDGVGVGGDSTGFADAWDVAAGGAGFVFVDQDGIVAVHNIDPTSGNRMSIDVGPGSSTPAVALDRIGDTDHFAVVYRDGSQLRLAVIQAGASFSEISMVGMTSLGSSPLGFSAPAVVRVSDAAVVAWGESNGVQMRFVTGAFATGVTMLPTVDDGGAFGVRMEVDLAYDAASRTVAAVFRRDTGGWRIATVDLNTRTVRAEAPLGAGTFARVAAAQDATFGVLELNAAGGGLLVRRRASDLGIIGGIMLPDAPDAIIGVPSGEPRYLAVTARSSYPIVCAP